MRKLNKIICQFCSFQYQSKTAYFKNIDMLKKTIEKQHFFVRKHHKQFGRQISTLFKNHQWGILKRGLRCINIGQMDSWLTLRKIGKSVSETLNRLYLKEMSKNEIQDMLFTLVELNYEPIPKLCQQINQNNEYLYDNIEQFIQQLSDYIKKISMKEQQEHYFQLIRKLLHTNSALFINKRKQIENHILQNYQSMSERRLLLNQVVAKGVISNFWSKNFKQGLMSKRRQQNNMNLYKSLYFDDLDIPTKIEISKLKQKIKTESQIANILSSLSYDIKSNVMINEYEVDVLISDSVIVEYNGHHHYVINSQALVPTLKDKWKCKILKERGFIIIVISYQQWKRLKLFQEKRLFLVTNIENVLMKHYGHFK